MEKQSLLVDDQPVGTDLHVLQGSQEPLIGGQRLSVAYAEGGDGIARDLVTPEADASHFPGIALAGDAHGDRLDIEGRAVDGPEATLGGFPRLNKASDGGDGRSFGSSSSSTHGIVGCQSKPRGPWT